MTVRFEIYRIYEISWNFAIKLYFQHTSLLTQLLQSCIVIAHMVGTSVGL